jgi:Protochlamydia outer membrane protein
MLKLKGYKKLYPAIVILLAAFISAPAIAAYRRIFDGENQDSGYAGGDRTLEFSRSNNNSDEGNMLDAFFGIGCLLILLNLWADIAV